METVEGLLRRQLLDCLFSTYIPGKDLASWHLLGLRDLSSQLPIWECRIKVASIHEPVQAFVTLPLSAHGLLCCLE